MDNLLNKSYEDYGHNLCYNAKLNENGLSIKIEIGGASGGNCYGDLAEYYQCDYSESDAITEALERFCKWLKQEFKLNELNVENFNPKFMEYDDDSSDWDYYGNYTSYKRILIPNEELKKCFKKLFDNIEFI